MLDPATVADLAAAVRAAAEQQRNFDEGHFPSGGEFIAPKACAGPIWDSYVTPAGIILFLDKEQHSHCPPTAQGNHNVGLSDDVFVVETKWGHPGPGRRIHLGKVNHPQGANLLADISARRAFGHFLLEAVAGKKIANAVAAASMVAVYTY